jgi:hypothetical protein
MHKYYREVAVAGESYNSLCTMPLEEGIGMEEVESSDGVTAVTWATEYFSAFFRRATFFLSSFVKGSFLF